MLAFSLSWNLFSYVQNIPLSNCHFLCFLLLWHFTFSHPLFLTPHLKAVIFTLHLVTVRCAHMHFMLLLTELWHEEVSFRGESNAAHFWGEDWWALLVLICRVGSHNELNGCGVVHETPSSPCMAPIPFTILSITYSSLLFSFSLVFVPHQLRNYTHKIKVLLMPFNLFDINQVLFFFSYKFCSHA